MFSVPLSNSKIKHLSPAILLLVSGEILSAEIKNDLIIPVSVQYESNPSYLSSNETSIYKQIFSPQFVSSVQDDRNLWSVELLYHLERSSDTSISNDRDDPAVKIAWTHEFETSNLSVNARREEGSTRETELSDSGQINIDGTRRSNSVYISWVKNLTDVLSIDLSGENTETTYLNADLVDYTTETISARMNYSFSEMSTMFLGIGKMRYEPILGQTSSNLQYITIGSELNITPATEAIISVGTSKTENFNSEEERQRQGSLTLNVDDDRLVYTLIISSSIMPSGAGGYTRADHFTGHVRYDLTETSNLGFEASVYKNLDIDENKISRYSISYIKELGEQWNIIFRGARRKLESNASGLSENNIFSISMSYTI